MVTERQNEILNLVVDIFTKTREPVGSKALQDVIQSSSAIHPKRHGCSSKQGLLEKAHTSSGRMPSRAGFQYFVQNSLDLELIDEQDVYQVVKPLISKPLS